ncbi:hypothetical protein MUK42_21128 [Musa troglodytarum]|uniref:Senescence regulator n=1 Tax=Musa troglodytarum TaxID=320322 RepID=A0A9E7FUG7_9LILI|nr:hypothetical protein MUK42_21128 [Musa troglodytarum]
MPSGEEELDRRTMGEEALTSVAPPSSASSPLRLLGILRQPDSDSVLHLELDESDVVWSTEYDERDSFDGLSSTSSNLVRSPLPASSCSPSRRLHPFGPERYGLSAALAQDGLPLVLQQRPTSRSTRTVAIAVPAGMAQDASVVGMVGRHQSAPVNIPAWPSWRKGRKADVLGGLADEKADKEERMLPPHVIVARSNAITFSVFEGVGRTLKGRDLRRVRNAVLQKTGFLDA